jgi:hypothetical protein
MLIFDKENPLERSRKAYSFALHIFKVSKMHSSFNFLPNSKMDHFMKWFMVDQL